ncbi:MAG TPA: hypothetical protein VKY19_27875 [Ktedonosporobacter sp.]|nr:hypothetical protein [Ktedonosporobacter sp.]
MMNGRGNAWRLPCGLCCGDGIDAVRFSAPLTLSKMMAVNWT